MENNNNDSADEVVVYGSEMCGACQSAKEFLQQKDVDFKFKDVIEDDDNVDELRNELDKCEKSRKCDLTMDERLTIPIIKMGDKLEDGFNKERLEEEISA